MLVIYTAIIGDNGDRLQAPKWQHPDVEFVCFSDHIQRAPKPWKVLPPLWRHPTYRRAARYHKLNAHILFPDAQATLWHDGSHQLVADPRDMVREVLQFSHFGTFRHPHRSCVYDELQACIKLRKDDPDVMRNQVRKYREAGYPPRSGLFETAVVVRDNSPEASKINAAWWQELSAGSLRDQLSINYAIWKHDMAGSVSIIPGSRDRSPWFAFRPHR